MTDLKATDVVTSTDPDPERVGGSAPLAYKDPEFLDSGTARSVRILSEYLSPLRALELAGIKDTIVFFGSARLPCSSKYYSEALQLAAEVTHWAKSIAPDGSRLVVCSGGGGGIMEAANRGAREAGGRTIGFNIGLPHEQRPNPYLQPELTFQFHYFFMRKLWFAHLARAMVVFPGGFGTLDEMFEILTLRQTRKVDREICVILYGREYWNEVINFGALVKHGMIAASDLKLMHVVDTRHEALQCMHEHIKVDEAMCCPDFAPSSTPWGGPCQSVP